ncbi:MAG: response regulator [Elusimicrobiota bacterium]
MKKRILVADDDKECSSLLKDYLSELGYEVLVVEDGSMLYRKAPEIMPDLIISDLDMPGLSGGTAQALLRISEKTREIPIIFITGQSEDRQARLVEFRPDTKILYKPLNLKDLAIAVTEKLGPP